MKLHINGEERSFDAPAPLTLAVLVEILGMKPDRVAVELNRDIIPRSQWPETPLNEGDRLEVVHFVGGGSARTRRLRPGEEPLARGKTGGYDFSRTVKRPATNPALAVKGTLNPPSHPLLTNLYLTRVVSCLECLKHFDRRLFQT
jgi:sulfur carrier protein